MKTFIVRVSEEYEIEAKDKDDAMKRVYVDGKSVFTEVEDIREDI